MVTLLPRSRDKFVFAESCAVLSFSTDRPVVSCLPQWFEKPYEERSSWLVDVRVDELWNFVRSVPTYRDLVAAIGYTFREMDQRKFECFWNNEVAEFGNQDGSSALDDGFTGRRGHVELKRAHLHAVNLSVIPNQLFVRCVAKPHIET